jgi:hypothetical protein
MFGLSIFKADDDLWSYGSCLLGQYVGWWLLMSNLGGSDILDDWCNRNYPTFSTYPHMIPLLPSRQALLMRHFSIFFMPSIMFVYVWAIDARLVGDYKYMCCVLKSPNGRPLWLSLWGAQCIHVRHNSSCTIVQLFITLWWMIKTPSKVLSWSKRVDRCCGLCVGISFASARLSVWG